MKRLSKSKSIDRFASEASSGESGGSSTDLAPRAPRRVDNAPQLPSRRSVQQSPRTGYRSSDDDEKFEEGRDERRAMFCSVQQENLAYAWVRGQGVQIDAGKGRGSSPSI